MKNLLIILNGSFPDILDTGGKQAVYNMIDYLRWKINISILYKDGLQHNNTTALELTKKWNNVKFYKYIEDKRDVKYISYFTKRLAYKFFGNPTSRLNREIENEQIIYSRTIDLIMNIINKEQIDIVQTEFSEGINYVYALPSTIKKVFIQHEIRFVRNELMLQQNAKSNTLSKYLIKKNKSEEIAAMNQYDSIVVFTEIDKAKLLDAGVKVPIHVSPVCISTNNNKKEFIASKHELSFLGGANHKPNLLGMEWFLDNVWPIILQKDNKIRLKIIGNWPYEIRNKFINKYKNISFSGIVKDLATVLPGSIMVIPITVGSGMRMKALEAIANGCTIISTSVGIEGLPFISGTDSIIADDKDTFANSILSLLNNPNRQKTFWYNSMQWYKEKYSKEALGDIRLNIYTNL